MKRLTTIVLFVFVLAGLAAAILLSTPQGAVSPVPPLFLEFASSEVKAIDIHNAQGDVRLERDPKDRERWRVAVEKVPVRASAEKVEELLNNLSRLAPKNFWPKAEVKASERKSWDLEKAPVRLKLEMEGRTLAAAFGGRTLEHQNVYAEKEGNGDVYVVPISGVEPLETAKAAELRERRPAGFSSGDAKVLSLRRVDGLALEAEKGGSRTWEVTAPFQGPADPAGIDALLAAALNVEVVDFVADGTPDLERYGLAKPRATISVRREGRDRPLVLLLGGDAGPDKVWFMEEGENSIYTCGPDLPNAVAKFDPQALRDRNLLRIGWAKIDSMEFSHPGQGAAPAATDWKLLRVLERWDVEKPERTPAETTLVDGLLDQIRSAEVAKFLDGEDPAKLGLGTEAGAPARLVLTGVDEAGTRTLLLGKPDADGKVPARLLPAKGAKDPPPVLLDGAFLERLEQPWLAFRSREVLKIDLGDVTGLSRKWPRAEDPIDETFLREKNAWKAAPGGKEPDADALGAALAHLLTVRATAFEAKTKEGLEKWGLGDVPAGPVITVHLPDAKGEKRARTLIYGNPVEGAASHYARLGDGDLVFRLPDQAVDGAAVVPLWNLLSSPWAKAPAKVEDKAPEEKK